MSSEPVRVMVEQGKKRAVASAIDWPGWGRSAKLEDPAMALLDEYRPRYALVAARAGLGAEFDAAGELEIVERLPGTGMSEFYGVSGQKLDSDLEPMTEAECERRIAILRACWATFDDVAARVSPDLRASRGVPSLGTRVPDGGRFSRGRTPHCPGGGRGACMDVM